MDKSKFESVTEDFFWGVLKGLAAKGTAVEFQKRGRCNFVYPTDSSKSIIALGCISQLSMSGTALYYLINTK